MAAKSELAKQILQMTYSELKDVASDFAAMCSPEESDIRKPPKTTTDFLELLHDWAEAQ